MANSNSISIFDSLERDLTEDEIHFISQTTQKTRHLSYRPPDLIERHARAGHIIAAYNSDDELIGWIEQYPLWSNWWGLSSLYVRPEYRDDGVGRGKLLPSAIKRLSNYNIYAATTNPTIQAFLPTQGFTNVSFWHYPTPLIISLIWKRYTYPATWLKLGKLMRQNFMYFEKRI